MIGGAQLYNQLITHPDLEYIFLTKIKQSFPCDVFFPKIPESFKSLSAAERTCLLKDLEVMELGVSENGVEYEYEIHRNDKDKEE